ncbi:MAG: hypothetical protein AVDCRST_MAG18-2038 [uncultured Thermomicrobiales bacterium]|uniref:Uncharacterized protein n=1 Tax=uncultured Thermomicrobiales bacterium TaxID=1645740 RepID=A0A6J4V7P6_9BACT|nr:MAG: hypothetical protein AVDCRST_MAG18-2038 [uncultured Thermomicrobiales bacterium]
MRAADRRSPFSGYLLYDVHETGSVARMSTSVLRLCQEWRCAARIRRPER